MNKLQPNKESGFTLIEIAIVLIIIGLLLGGIMKGQTMVKNAKIKRYATDTQSIQGAINAYMDSYWVLPGDDSTASARFPGTVPANGNGDGDIDGLFEPATLASDETAEVFNHMRCAELVKGSCVAAATATIMPFNATGGSLGVADGTGGTTVLGIAKKVVCMGTVESEYAMIYDTQHDDGVGNAGDIRGSQNTEVAATPGTAQAYGAGQSIHICTGF